jgi:hypothetical protein
MNKIIYMLFTISITCMNAFSYEEYIPEDKDTSVQRFYNKCYKPNNVRKNDVQKMVMVKSYKKGNFKVYSYRERINQIMLVTDEPFRPNNTVEWQLQGVDYLSYKNLTINYKKTLCL